ncbi:membrane protein required for colicin V production [Gilliamella bombicola]|uniref:Membrane protein required for colicin V production n=2 Tax=Orbaceae TaxID=1240483 RepID=A0A1C4BXG1_9GAMM|nr:MULTISPECIES: CvpA family protein [Gilliamella]SCC11547.1 membrane protein required for colicin V production [Gilliamella bombicola]
MMMNWVDFTIIGVIAFSALISIVRGFVREALSLISWILAFFISSRFYIYITDYLTYFDSDVIRIAVAIVILFIATLLVCSIVSYIIGQLVQKTGLSGTDRVLGICFGVLRGILVVAAVLFFVDTFTPLSRSVYWTQSQLIPHFHFIIRWFFDFIQQSSSFLVQ